MCIKCEGKHLTEDGFVNVQTMNAEYPAYGGPDVIQINVISVGDTVKVTNEFDEKFWAIIEEISPEGRITARVDNDLVQTPKYNCGDLIIFDRECIFDIIYV